MTPEHWIPIAAQAVITLGGMFFASKLAISSSIKQFRSQKWWERQGDVYNRLLENLAIIKHCVAARLEYDRHPDYMLGPNKLLEGQIENAAAEIAKIGAMGPYYLTEAASKSVDAFLKEWSIDTGCGPEDEYRRRLEAVGASMTIIRQEANKALGLAS